MDRLPPVEPFGDPEGLFALAARRRVRREVARRGDEVDAAGVVGRVGPRERRLDVLSGVEAGVLAEKHFAERSLQAGGGAAAREVLGRQPAGAADRPVGLDFERLQ